MIDIDDYNKNLLQNSHGVATITHGCSTTIHKPGLGLNCIITLPCLQYL